MKTQTLVCEYTITVNYPNGEYADRTRLGKVFGDNNETETELIEIAHAYCAKESAKEADWIDGQRIPRTAVKVLTASNFTFYKLRNLVVQL